MSRGGNKIQTDVDSGVVVVEEGALYFQFLLQVVFELCVNVVHNGFKAVREERERKPVAFLKHIFHSFTAFIMN